VRERPLLFLVPLLMLVAACSGGGGGDDEEDATVLTGGVADRYLRLFEGGDFGTSVFYFDRELPPDLAELLNPGLTADTPEEDIVAIPVPPEGVLVGSYQVRRRDGTQHIWLSYDVPGFDTEVESVLSRLMNETPWQVTGGQSNELLSAISFQSTVSGDIEGFVAMQALPSTPTYTVAVEREGQSLELEVPRGASVPELDMRFRELSGGLEVTDVLADELLQEGDLIVAVGGLPVASERDLFKAYREVAASGDPRTSVLYRLQIAPSSAAAEPVFAIPPARPVPDRFPADFFLLDGLTVVDVSWSVQPAGELYQITMVTERSAFDVAEEYRTALEEAGWELTSDEAQGFGTVLNFADEPSGLLGIADIDQFPEDDSLNAVTVQIQSGGGTN